MAVNNIKLPWRDWTIVREVGRGTFGTVYEAEREMLGRKEKAAIKVIPIPRDENAYEMMLMSSGYDDSSVTKSIDAELKRVNDEYSLMSSMKGMSNIVSCEDFAYTRNENGKGYTVFIRMELLKSLQEIIKEKKRAGKTFTEEEVIRLGKDICSALMICEKNDIIHRDIKPQNIMISPKYGTYNLGDFGTARNLDHTTNATFAGTVSYMAPEVFLRKKYGRSVDIYSLGLVMYWLLNNYRMPFVPADGVVTADVMKAAEERRVTGEKLPAPCCASKELSRIILKACAFNSEDRYESAGEMLRDLEDAEMSNRASAHQADNYSQTVYSPVYESYGTDDPDRDRTVGMFHSVNTGDAAFRSYGVHEQTVDGGQSFASYRGSGVNDASGYAAKPVNDIPAYGTDQANRISADQTAGAAGSGTNKKTGKNTKLIIAVCGVLLVVIGLAAIVLNGRSYEQAAGVTQPADDVQPLQMDDFEVVSDYSGKEDIINYFDSHDYAWSFYYYDPKQDESKEGVIVTARDIMIGSGSEDVLEKYGKGEYREFDETSDVIVLSGEDAAAKTVKSAKYTLQYRMEEDRGWRIVFYFDDEDSVIGINFLSVEDDVIINAQEN